MPTCVQKWSLVVPVIVSILGLPNPELPKAQMALRQILECFAKLRAHFLKQELLAAESLPK